MQEKMCRQRKYHDMWFHELQLFYTYKWITLLGKHFIALLPSLNSY